MKIEDVEKIDKVEARYAKRIKELEEDTEKMYEQKGWEDSMGEKSPGMKALDEIWNYEDEVIEQNCVYMEKLNTIKAKEIKKILSTGKSIA